MTIKGIIDLDNGEFLEATGKHRISALDIQGSETAKFSFTFYQDGTAVTDNSVLSGAVIEFGVKAEADYTGTSYMVYHNSFSASSDGLTYTATPTWATSEVESALGNSSSVKLHGQVKIVISGITYYSQVFEVEIHNDVIQAAGETSSVIFPRLITSTSDPTVNDDIGDGYGVSSTWLNTSSNAVHVLMDNTEGAAVWAGFLALTNGAIATDLLLADNVKAIFGTSSDGLEVYHNSSNSYIKDSGTGGLYLQTNGPAIYLQDTDGNGMAQFTDGGSCFLMDSGAVKFQTTSTGATVTGKLVVSGDLDVDGLTTSFDSQVVTVEDPVFGIGGETAPNASDNKDRGISFRYFRSGESAKVGFFGWDNSANAFTLLTDTNDDSTEVFSGTAGNLNVGNVLHGDSNASNPSVSFSSDPNTGFYHYGADTIGISTNGTYRAQFSASGLFETWAGIQLKGGVIKTTDGDASGPGYSFEGDPNSGIFSVAADQLGISTGGSERVHIYNDGFDLNNLSLVFKDSGGTGRATVSIPSQHFAINVYGTSGWINNAINIDNDTGSVALGNSATMSTANAQRLIVGDGAGAEGITIYSGTDNSGFLYFADGTSSSASYRGALQYNHTNDTLTFDTAASNRMTLTSTGLGIGCTPTANLDITSSSDQQHLYIQGANSGVTPLARLKTIAGGSVLELETGTASDSRDIIKAKNSSGTVFNLQADGKLCIGAETPGSILEIQGDGGNNKQLRLASGSSSVYWDLGRNYSTGHFEITEDSGDTYFLIDKDNGNIGINNSSPAQKLSIQFADTDTSYSGGTGGDWGSEGLLIENTSSTANTMAMIQLRNGDADIHLAGIRQGTNDSDLGFFFEGTEKMRLDSSGNLAIGVTDPDQKLDVNGNIRIPNQGKIVFGSAGTATDYLELYDVGSSGSLLKLVQDTATRFSIEGTTGNVAMTGDVETTGDFETTTASKGIVLKSPNGTRYRLHINDDASVAVTAM